MYPDDKMTEYPGRPETEDISLMETWDRAVQGDANAQYMLGWAYENGLGVRKSHDRCLEWYTMSKNNGNKKALLALGDIMWGAGVCWFEEAVELLERHAKDGDATAMYWLAGIYDSGAGCEKDPMRAMELYQACSESGSDLADGRMGMHYFEGDGVEQDVQKGLKMIECAGRKRDSEALYYLGCSYRDGFNVEKSQKKAVKYLRMAARKEAFACLALADMYSTEEYGIRSAKKAAKWYLRGAGLGGQDCMAKAVKMYREGWLLEKNESKAEMWEQRFLEMDSKIYNYERR